MFAPVFLGKRRSPEWRSGLLGDWVSWEYRFAKVIINQGKIAFCDPGHKDNYFCHKTCLRQEGVGARLS